MATKKIPVLVKQTLEKVVVVEIPFEMDRYEVLEIVEEAVNDGNIVLDLNDFRYDQTVNVCLNCTNDRVTHTILDNKLQEVQ